MSREQMLADTFVELADTLVTEFEAIDLMHTLTDRAVALLEADASGLILADPRGGLEVVASTSHAAQLLELFVIQNHEGPCLECLRTGEPLVNLDLDEVEERWPRFRAATREAGFRSTHAIPMRLRQEVVGVLNLFCENRSILSDSDVGVAQALADVATIGLLQERAIRQHELLSEQLQSALNSRVLIEQAKGVLAERAAIGIDEAFDLIRGHSRRTRSSLTELARAVVTGQVDVATLRG